MTLAIYRKVTYDMNHNRTVRYSLYIDRKYIMECVTDSYKKKIERNVIKLLTSEVFTQPYINQITNPLRYYYIPQGELIHEENDTKLLKELQVKLRKVQFEEDFKDER